MGNLFASGTSVSYGSLKRNNFLIGIDSTFIYPPSDVSGFWFGIVPPTNAYTVYEQKSYQGPSIRVSQNDSDFIKSN